MQGNAGTKTVAVKRNSARQRELNDLLTRDHTLNGAILFGLEGRIIEMQARAMEVLNQPTSVTGATRISGMARRSVDESLDRIAGAFAKMRIPEFEVSVLVNLAPADLPKHGTWLDLPLAVVILQAAGILPDLAEHLEGDYVLFGEVGLHGEVRRVPGALSLAYTAKPGQTLIVPASNEKECALILAKPGHEMCRIAGVSTLEEVIDFFRGKGKLGNALREAIHFESAVPKALDFGRILGQERAKEAATIAAAGGHNLLLIGPPGEGKSLLASAMPGILPRLSDAEKVELTKVYSAVGGLDRDGMAVTRRPMRHVHHTASKESLVGGGAGIPKPGEITLAHLGVLFLDELPEFSRATIESIRQPIETGEIVISRVGATLRFPCRFTLLAAMNPCPCGYYGTDMCVCKEAQVRVYQRKISGPMLDRIDLQVELERLTTDQRFAQPKVDESPRLRTRIEAARQRQIARFTGMDVAFNAAIPGGRVRDFCDFSSAGFARFKAIIDENSLSTRSMDRLAKVSRTVADLAGIDQVQPVHLDKATSFVVGGMLREGG